jgi:hypothetical protein
MNTRINEYAADRLRDALKALKFTEERRAWAKTGLVTSIRQFAALHDDAHLEQACDVLIREIDEHQRYINAIKHPMNGRREPPKLVFADILDPI